MTKEFDPFQQENSVSRELFAEERAKNAARLEIAKELVRNIDGLNPQCLSLGAGMMAHLKELAERFLAIRSCP